MGRALEVPFANVVERRVLKSMSASAGEIEMVVGYLEGGGHGQKDVQVRIFRGLRIETYREDGASCPFESKLEGSAAMRLW